MRDIGQRMIMPHIAKKNAYVHIYLTVFINFCIQICYKFHKLFSYDSPENKFNLAIKNVKVNPRSSLKYFGQLSSKPSMKSYVQELPMYDLAVK